MDSAGHAVVKALGKKGGSKKPHVHGMHIRRAASGGFIVNHQMMGSDGSAQPDQEHAVPDAGALQDHVQASMGDQPPMQMPQGGGDAGGDPGAGAQTA